VTIDLRKSEKKIQTLSAKVLRKKNRDYRFTKRKISQYSTLCARGTDYWRTDSKLDTAAPHVPFQTVM
jgi:hypothetical protein